MVYRDQPEGEEEHRRERALIFAGDFQNATHKGRRTTCRRANLTTDDNGAEAYVGHLEPAVAKVSIPM